MKIVIRRSRLDIYPYKLHDSPTLEKRLSIYDWTTRQITMKMYHYDNKENILSIPKGYSVFDAKSALNADDFYDIEIVEKREEYTPTRIVKIDMRRGIVPRDEHQENAIEFLCQDKDNDSQKYLVLDTGVGKTYCAIQAASLLNLPLFIIVGKSALIKQWYEAILKYTYSSDDDIEIIKGRISIQKSLQHKEYKNFYICSTETLSIAAEEGILDTFMRRIGIGIKVIDEAHELMSATTIIDLHTNIKYNYYLTATPQRSDNKEDRLFSLITKTIPRFGEYTLDLNKYTHVKKVYINTYPSGWDQKRCKTRNGFAALIYEKYIFRNEDRRYYFLNIIIHILHKMLTHDPESKILILFASNKNIETMAKLVEDILETKVGRFNSLLKDIEEKRKELDNNIILSTIKSSGAGLDLKNLRVVINFVPFRSFVMLHQLFGRLRKIDGKACFYFDVVDEGFFDTMRFSSIRDQFFKKKAKTITNINFTMKSIKEKALHIITDNNPIEEEAYVTF